MSAQLDPRETAKEEQVNLLALAAVLVLRWRTVVGAVLVGALIAIGLVYLSPTSYVARTVIVPSTHRGSSAGSLLAAAHLQPAFASLLAGSATANQRLLDGVLKSRTLADSLVVRMGMTREVHPQGEAEVRRILTRRTRIEHKSDGSVIIQVRDSDPDRAARIANEFPSLANQIMARLSADVALHRQEFLVEQLLGAHERLVRSEERLAQFQLVQEAPELQEQARRAMEAAAQLQQQIIEQEIRLARLRRTATPDNPELRSALGELSAIRVQLARLKSGEGSADRVFPSLRESPELKLEATRLLREYNRDEQVYLSLTAALADAQLDANNNLPVVSVLDPALVPESPSRVNLWLALAVAVLLGVVAGIVMAYLQEYLMLAQRDPKSAQFFAAWEQLRSDVTGYLPWRGHRARVVARS